MLYDAAPGTAGQLKPAWPLPAVAVGTGAVGAYVVVVTVTSVIQPVPVDFMIPT